MQPTARIGIGFIGAGSIAAVHKAALERCAGARLAAVHDIDPRRSAALAEGTGARVCATADELVAFADVDAVFVLTPLASHCEHAMRALRAGKHTFIEKPVTLSRQDGLRMIAEARERSVVCVPGHNYIHAAALRQAREMIAAGKLGDIHSLWILFILCLPLDWSRRLPGVLREVMIHHFYSLLFLMGRPETVFATNSDPRRIGAGREDQALVVCRMPNGALANLFGSFCTDDLTADPWTVLYKILGSEGSVSHSWSSSRLRSRPQPIWDLPAYWDTFIEEDRYFIEECLGKGRPPLSSMEDMLTCLDILEAAEASIASGRAVPLARPEGGVVDGSTHLATPAT